MSRRAYHHGDLRTALVDATLELMAENGVQGFSVAEAARRTGVSISAPYRHFADRDQLLAAAAVRGYEELLARFREAIACSRDAGRRGPRRSAPPTFASPPIAARCSSCCSAPAWTSTAIPSWKPPRRWCVEEVSGIARRAGARRRRRAGRRADPGARGLAQGHATLLLDGAFGEPARGGRPGGRPRRRGDAGARPRPQPPVRRGEGSDPQRGVDSSTRGSDPSGAHDPRAVRGGGRRRSRQGVAAPRGRGVHLRPGARADRPGGGRRWPSAASAAATSCSPPRATGPSTCSPGSRSCYLGAIHVPSTRAAREAELAGLVGQVEPKLVVGDDDAGRACSPPRPPAPDGPGPGRRRRPGRAHPDLGHDRALEARDPDPPGLRDGRRGVPVVDGADRRRPADDLAAALPHQRARLLDARLGGRAGRAWCCCPASRPARSSTPPGATAPPSSTRSARCSRSSCASPSAPDDADNPLRLCYTGPSPAEERQLEIERALRPADRVRLRPVGDALRHDLAARDPALRHARRRPPAPDARPRQRGRVIRDGAASRSARSASSSCATRRS